MNGSLVVRILLGVVGALLLIGGVSLAFVGAGLFVGAFWMIVAGVVLVIVAAVEITRYRSEAAEVNHYQPGPGGGETVAPEPRFKRTEEVFVDPTSQRRMRVFADPNTGERRYVAEG
jgi:hypothetical protein